MSHFSVLVITRDPVVWARWERQMKALRRQIDAAQRLWGVKLNWN